jgi:hypothetical protein
LPANAAPDTLNDTAAAPVMTTVRIALFISILPVSDARLRRVTSYTGLFPHWMHTVSSDADARAVCCPRCEAT